MATVTGIGQIPVIDDYLGEPWQMRVVPVTPSKDARGADRAVLVHQADHASRMDGKPLKRAALYLPGFADSFFQAEHAGEWIAAGIEFYGLDCRAQGRAAAGLPGLEQIYDLRLRNEEISLAIRYLREIGHEHVTLIGHSTGGLQAAYYTGLHPRGESLAAPDVVILNSPWFDLAQPEPIRTGGAFLAHALAPIAPGMVLSKLSEYYAQSLHVLHGGEWEFDTTHKPLTRFPVRAGFLSSVRRIQGRLTHKRITQPVLIASSTRLGKDAPGSPDLKNSDVILNPEHMRRIGEALGPNVTIRTFEGGIHDLACSAHPIRTEYTRSAIDFARHE